MTSESVNNDTHNAHPNSELGAQSAAPGDAAAPGDTAAPSLTPGHALWVSQVFDRCVHAMEQSIRGKRRVLELVMASVLAGGHVLLEDVPGTGKTALAQSLAQVIQGNASRIQFTPDLLPGDITGSSVFDQRTAQFEFHPGPIFANIVLADEINRASPKTQSALLEVMEEAKVTVDGRTHQAAEPFTVIATQNPIEQLGTYRLPEAQLDRFMITTSIGYPDATSMMQILSRAAAPRHTNPTPAVVTTAMIAQAQRLVASVYTSPLIADYVIRLVDASRAASAVRLGVSVRGAIALVRLASAWAAAHGRHYTVPSDISDLALVALSHRLVLHPEAEFDGVTAEQVLSEVLLQVEQPHENGVV